MILFIIIGVVLLILLILLFKNILTNFLNEKRQKEYILTHPYRLKLSSMIIPLEGGEIETNISYEKWSTYNECVQQLKEEYNHFKNNPKEYEVDDIKYNSFSVEYKKAERINQIATVRYSIVKKKYKYENPSEVFYKKLTNQYIPPIEEYKEIREDPTTN